MELRAFLAQAVTALERGWVDPKDLVKALDAFRRGDHSDVRELRLLFKQRSIDQSISLDADDSLDQSDTLVGFQQRPSAPSNGQEPVSRYVPQNLLSEGGFGRVYECTDQALGRRVAVKTLRPQYASSPDQARVLSREARLTGSLEHPNIVPIYDVGSFTKQGPFYVMRLVDAPSLEHVLVSLRQGEPGAKETWTLMRLLRTFVQVCLAVHYAHSRGVIHCDLKPDNILLGKFGEVMVSDWGLAFAIGDEARLYGGTPTYMAPEQIARAKELDARTDVFALGGILYRILALRTPFAGSTRSDLMRQREVGVVPLPSTVAPRDRNVPPELEGVAMKALATDPTARFQDCHALADAVDAFLEGTLDREQRQKRALGLVTQGDDLSARYHDALAQRHGIVSERATLEATVDAWAPLEERRRVWKAQDELVVFDAVLVRTLQEAISSYEQALVEQPGNRAARKGLSYLYATQVERAQERRAVLDKLYFEGLLKHYDDEGVLSRAGSRPGWINIDVIGEVDHITLALYEERDRQLIAGNPRRLRRNALEAVPAAQGSYELMVRLARAAGELRVPVLVRGDRETRVKIDLRAFGLPREDEKLVIGTSIGDVSSGGIDPGAARFFMHTFPVTFGQYLRFLEERLATAPERVEALIPRVRAPMWAIEGGRLVPTRAHYELGLEPESCASVALFGVTALAVAEYVEWWSERTGLRYRLPTEDEWELAAQGADGRAFPWGDRFEAIFCKMRLSRAGAPRPEAVGAFAYDVSPYGVRDLAGGIADMCTPSTRGRVSDPGVGLVSRGGAWCDPEFDCAIASRRRIALDETYARVGFRLVRDATTPVSRFATTMPIVNV